MIPDSIDCEIKVLVVSTKVNFLYIISYGLKELGFSVETVLSLPEAMETIEIWEPDFVLSDITVEEAQGISLYDFIHMYNPGMIKAGCFAVLSPTEDVPVNKNHNPDVTYICKPPDFSKLVELIHNNCNRLSNVFRAIPEAFANR
jgi:DNA-binding NtrC family response regulator